jgi:hypothetical protein
MAAKSVNLLASGWSEELMQQKKTLKRQRNHRAVARISTAEKKSAVL